MSLRPDDIGTGMYVTVLSAAERESYSLFGGATRAVDKSMHGVVLKVKAVSYPYVAVADLAGETRHLDLREYVFARVSKEYVREMRKAARQQPAIPNSSPGGGIHVSNGTEDDEGGEA
jgi:hypothetical protein